MKPVWLGPENCAELTGFFNRKKMRKLLNMLAIVSVSTLLSFTVELHGDGTYILDASKSNIEWLGKKFTGEHSGDLSLKSGQIVLGSHGIASAKFVIDMTTIDCTDMEGEHAEDLESHLKDDDFFSSVKFPTATIEMISATSLTEEANGNNFDIKANLTIKGITHEISFPAKLNILDHKVEFMAKVVFDRTKWGIKYKSKTIFTDLGDKFIYDDIDLKVKLIADLQ